MNMGIMPSTIELLVQTLLSSLLGFETQAIYEDLVVFKLEEGNML